VRSCAALVAYGAMAVTRSIACEAPSVPKLGIPGWSSHGLSAWRGSADVIVRAGADERAFLYRAPGDESGRVETAV
jgi:hypothetical protein